MKKMWKWIVAAILVLLVVVFSVMNTRNVRLDLGVKSFYLPLIYVVLGSFLVGGIVTMLLWLTSNFENRHNVKALRKSLDDLQSSFDDRLATEVSATKIEYEALIEEKNQELLGVKKEFTADSNLKNQEIQELKEKLVSLVPPAAEMMEESMAAPTESSATE